MPRGKEGSFDTMRQFLRDYLKDGEPFKASIAYAEFWKSGKAVDDLGRTISQKDFAMFLRTEVLKKDGLLKRTAHGIYEKRIDPEDHGVTFARKNPESDISFDADDAYLDGIQVSPADARLDKLWLHSPPGSDLPCNPCKKSARSILNLRRSWHLIAQGL